MVTMHLVSAGKLGAAIQSLNIPVYTRFSRVCPGQSLAAKTVWLAITRMLWAFNIGPAVDANGHTIPLSPENCTSGITS